MKYLYLLLIFVLFLSCREEFVGEPYDPRMPVVSSLGRNVSGAYVNGVPNVTVRNVYSSFSGEAREDSLYFSLGHPFDFKIVDENINDTVNFDILQGRTFDLSDLSRAYYNGNQSVEGIIRFNHSPSVLSGTFYFHTNESRITGGRFDYSY